MIRHAVYIGPLTHLQGMTANVQDSADNALLVQFDDVRAYLDPKAQPGAAPFTESLGYGWRPFQAKDFQIEEGAPA
jgi:hypothetical protein